MVVAIPLLSGATSCTFDGWMEYRGDVSWRTGFPLDVFANFPTTYDFTSPGPSGAGDPSLLHANLVAPYQTLDPRLNSSFRGALATSGSIRIVSRTRNARPVQVRVFPGLLCFRATHKLWPIPR